MNKAIKTVPNCFMAVMLMALCAVTTAHAAAPALQSQVLLRPLTPQDKKDYALADAQGASGLTTVGKGQPAYLEALVNNAVPDADITNVTWVLTVRPPGSAAALAASPLGTNVPTYRMADRFNNLGAPVYKVAGRQLLLPDVTGLYTVKVTIQTASSGSTNLTQNVTAGTYLGANTCALCHSGGLVAPDKYEKWSKTPHASFFTRAIDGLGSSHYGKNCISCHTVGYDANTNAVNGGFDDVAASVGWTFPAVLTNGNWATSAPAIKNLANIQCENCHGAGSEHALGELFNPQSPAAKAAISVTFDAGNCAQCHDSKPNYSRSAEWNNSLHARVTRTPSGGANRAACARCHTGGGFAGYADTLGTTNLYSSVGADTTYTAITCTTCHDPHSDDNPHQLRAGPNITLGDGTTVTNAGSGGFCMNCHQSRNGSVTNSIEKYPLGQQTWLGGSSFGPHDNPAADMLEGVNGWTYGQVIPSSAHRFAVTNTCVTCHMQPVAPTDPSFLHGGGHTFKVMCDPDSDGKTVNLVGACQQCHGPSLTSFDYPVQDYNGDGVIEGVQTEVQHLLDKLSTLLPNSTYQADGNYVADGLVKTLGFNSVRTNWPSKFLKAGYNFQFVNNDLSKGVHNAPYAVGLLKASIADLTGDANSDGLPDAWQLQYFGANWASNPNAAPNASAAGDGIPNWIKYTLSLNPLIAGTVVPDGVVWANGTAIGGATNTIHIFTAAEIVFDTEVGKTYQIQAVSTVAGGWQNIGLPIPGTGQSISYVTPTRSKAQQFYRVSHTP